MKKLSLEMLRLTSDEVLGRSQMKKIHGGNSYTCSCRGGSPFYVWADNQSEAEEIAEIQCSSSDVSCAIQ